MLGVADLLVSKVEVLFVLLLDGIEPRLKLLILGVLHRPLLLGLFPLKLSLLQLEL